MKKVVLITIFSIFTFVFGNGFVFAETNSSMTVEVDISGFNETSGGSEISIEVPDFIDLGQISKEDPVSDEPKIKINNTGKTNITVTPLIKDENEEILRYIQFRFFKQSSNPELNVPIKIGDFNFNIDKPAAGKKSSKEFYIALNMTEFDGWMEDIENYNADILFLATAG